MDVRPPNERERHDRDNRERPPDYSIARKINDRDAQQTDRSRRRASAEVAEPPRFREPLDLRRCHRCENRRRDEDADRRGGGTEYPGDVESDERRDDEDRAGCDVAERDCCAEGRGR